MTASATESLSSLEARASNIINPDSGLANDYLNHFNEILLLIENLPVMLPEMVDELLQWTPVSYEEYFQRSNLPGSPVALAAYKTLDPALKRDFEGLIGQLNVLSLQSVEEIKKARTPTGEILAEDVSDFCEQASVRIRSLLETITDLVNHGHKQRDETPQHMANRLLSA